jgi:hypothetical protein
MLGKVREGHHATLPRDCRDDGLGVRAVVERLRPVRDEGAQRRGRLGQPADQPALAARIAEFFRAQADYAAANDLLCKISNSMRAWRPDTRGIAIDWTAWGEIGATPVLSPGALPRPNVARSIPRCCRTFR